MRLQGRTAIVTGASRGIGEAIATAFAREGAEVVVTARKQDALEAAAARIREATGGSVRAVACHAGRVEEIEALFERVGAVDVLVNNAATNPYFGPMMGADLGAWDKTFEVNVKGPFAMSRELARRLVEEGRGGSIVNLTSVFGLRGAPWQGIYAMTKAAVVSLTRTLALEWGPAGIRVNAIAPGLVETRFAKVLVEDDAMRRGFTDRTALGRHAQPEEIAGIAVHLASDEASFTTGQVFVVDGGFLSG